MEASRLTGWFDLRQFRGHLASHLPPTQWTRKDHLFFLGYSTRPCLRYRRPSPQPVPLAGRVEQAVRAVVAVAVVVALALARDTRPATLIPGACGTPNQTMEAVVHRVVGPVAAWATRASVQPAGAWAAVAVMAATQGRPQLLAARSHSSTCRHRSSSRHHSRNTRSGTRRSRRCGLFHRRGGWAVAEATSTRC